MSAVVPRCTIVTGPRQAGKTRWLQEAIHAARSDQPSSRCAVLTAEVGATGMEQFAQVMSGITVRRLFLPCPCCPAAADLPRHARALMEESRADWLFVELPVLSAIGLIAELDALMSWPREIVVCLSADWAKARHTCMLSPFQSQMIAAADRVIGAPARPVVHDRSAGLHGRKGDAPQVLRLG